MHFYEVMVPDYGSKTYTYRCEQALEHGTLVRMKRRQFGSTASGRLHVEGTVVGERTDVLEAFPCEPLLALCDVSTAELEAELLRRKDVEAASLFGVSVSLYREMRDHFEAQFMQEVS